MCPSKRAHGKQVPLGAFSAAVRACTAATVLAFAWATESRAADRAWFGGSDDWGIDTNWNPPGVPAAGDRVILGTGMASLSFGTTIGGFDQGNGVLDGTGNLTVSGGSGVRFEAIDNPHDVSLLVVAVPEAQTYALMLPGLALLWFAGRRRRALPDTEGG